MQQVERKIARYKALTSHLLPVADHMGKHGLRIAPTLELFRLKMVFLLAIQEHDVGGPRAAFHHSLQDAISAGLPNALQQCFAVKSDDSSRASASDATSAALWMREIMCKGLELLIRSWAYRPSEFGGDVLSWASDLDSSREDLVASFDSGDIAEATDALHAVASLLKGALDPAQASPQEVQRGFDILKLRHLKGVHDVLQESSVYGHLNEKLTALLQRSAEDDIGDLKLACATASVADSRLLSCRASDEDIGGRVLVLGHVETVTSGTVGEVFREALDQADEAMAIWSEVRRNEQMGCVNALFGSIAKKLAVADLAFSWLLCSQTAHINLGSVASIVENSDNDTTTKWKLLLPLANAVVGRALEEDTCLEFCHNYAATARPGEHGSDALGSTQLKKSIGAFLNNSLIRKSIRRIMLLIQGFLSVKIPLNGAVAAEDFVLHSQQGTQDQSFHTKAVCFQREAESLANAGDFEFDPSIINGFEKVSIASTEGRWLDSAIAELSISKLTTFTSDIIACIGPFEGNVRSVLTASASYIAESYLAALALDVVICGDKACVGEGVAASVSENIAALVDVPLATRACTFDKVGKAVAERRRAHLTAMLAMLKELASAWSSAAVPYGVLQLFLARGASCSSGSEDAPSVGAASFLAMLQYYGEMAHAAILLAYMCSAISGSAGVVVADKGPKLRDELIRCVNDVAKAYGRAGALDECIGTSGIQWIISPACAKLWWLSAYAVVEGYKVHVLRKLADAVQEQAMTLNGLTPQYNAYISDEVYLKLQAKRHLLDWKDRPRHSDLTVQLFRAIANLESARTDLMLKGLLEEYVPEQLKLARCVFEDAKRAVTIIAHVNALQGLTGDEQRDQISELLTKGHDIPLALKAALTKACDASKQPCIRKRKNGD